jgi:D-alanyl-D-alanine carboxypeptidase
MKVIAPLALIAGLFGVQAGTTVLQGDAPGAPREPVAAATSALAPAAASPASSVLHAQLNEIIRRPGWTDDRWSVMVVSLDRGDTLFAHNAHELLAPASNMKLFTTAAALYYLGPEYRWNTFLMATGPVQDGVVMGDLVVYGTGDPTFSGRFGGATAVWQRFADALEALGVREVRGDIVGDASYFQGSGAGEGWQHSYMNAAYAASAGALSYTENVATLQISPASQAGWRPEVQAGTRRRGHRHREPGDDDGGRRHAHPRRARGVRWPRRRERPDRPGQRARHARRARVRPRPSGGRGLP